MRFCGLSRQVAVVCAVVVGFAVAPAACFADGYQIISLGSDQGVLLTGITDSGTVVLNDSMFCATTCYATYTNGAVTDSTTLPSLVFDDGSPCNPGAPGGFTVEHAVCNGSEVAFTGYSGANPLTTGVYSGTDLLADLIAAGGEGSLMVNALGDVVWDDHFGEEFYEAIPDPTPAPEPASWLLVVTGVLALVVLARTGEVKARRR
jgi:hypothetical protein